VTDDDQAWIPRLLREFGYRGKRQDNTWSEVLLVRDGERWLGRGLDHASALADALAQMLPSAAARLLYDARLADAPADTAATAAALVAATVPAIAVATAVIPTVAAVPAVAAVAAVAAAPEPEPATPTASPASPITTSPEPEARPEPPKLQRIVLPSYPANAVAEARDTLDDILKEIHESRPDFALMAPRQQKVHMLAWICRARGYDEQFTGEHRINSLVRKIAHELTNISKIMWPGSVQALQMNARPDCVVGELGLKTIHVPRTWHEASEFVQQHRERALASDVQLDDYGWVDDARRPPSGDPRTLLREAVQLIEGIAGPVQEAPARHFSNPPEEIGNDTVDALVRAAQHLRAIRGHTLAPELWGAAMGRMRWLVGRLGDRAHILRKWLDPEFRPPVERNTAASLEQARVKKETVKDQLPPADSDNSTLAAWLVRAFDVLSTPEIVGLLAEPQRAQAQGLDDDSLPDADRRLRRRLRDLRAQLHGGGRDAATDAGETDESPKSEPPVAAEPVSEDVVDPADPLVAQVRLRVQGKSALFVSNRDDPDLKARLEDRLDLKITWCDGNPRKVQAQCDSIARGSYDLVLIATGFQAHTIDGSLARAARAVDVPYVRVFKGRPLACVRALARTFGLAENPT
jgi:hypothetical protein